MPDQIDVCPNGVDGSSGAFALPRQPLEQIAAYIQKSATDPFESRVIEVILQHYRRINTYAFDLPSDVDAQDLAQAGWGVIFPGSADPTLIEILQPLLDWRRGQAGDLFKIFEQGYVQGESATDFLMRNSADPSLLDPRRMPFYLLLVGGPEQIPFTFQAQLSRLGYAVGRLAFSGPFDYAQYANSLIRMEQGDYLMPRTATFFDAAKENDPGTILASQHMVRPLVGDFDRDFAGQDWKIQHVSGAYAIKRNLESFLGGGRTPAFLFVNAEGMQFPAWHADQQYKQGALLCNDWPGPSSGVAPSEDSIFAAADIWNEARLFGLVAFFYASFSLGTPPQDEIQRMAVGGSGELSALTAALPQRMLSHSAGSALAVVGMTGRAWGYSFAGERLAEQTETYSRMLARLVAGERLGSALREVSARAAEYSTLLEEKLQDFNAGLGDPFKLVSVWAACQDALSLSLLGDPAVKLWLTERRGMAEQDLSTLSARAAVLETKSFEAVEAGESEVEGEIPEDKEPGKKKEEEEIVRPVVELSEEERRRVQRILAIVQPLSNDQPAEKDLLGIEDEVHALADALILRQIRPPLAVGILGGWGSGKSSVMNLIHKRIAERRAERVERGWEQDLGSEALSVFVGHTYQVSFNAWTYAKSNLWASLMQTIFFELNRQMSQERELADERVKKDHPELKPDNKEMIEVLLREALKKGGKDYASIYKLNAASRLNPLWEGLRQRKQQQVEALQKTESDIAEMKAQRDGLLLKRQQAALQRLERQAQVQAITLLVETTKKVLTESGAPKDVKNALEKLEGEKKRLKEGLEGAVTGQTAPEDVPPEAQAVKNEDGLLQVPPQGSDAARGGKETEALLGAQMLELFNALHGFGMTLARMSHWFKTISPWGKAVVLALGAVGLLALFLPFALPEASVFKDTFFRLAALVPMVLPWARTAVNWSKQVNQMLGDYKSKVDSERANLLSRLGEELNRRQSLDVQQMHITLLRAGADVDRQRKELKRLAEADNLAALDENLRRAELKAEEQRRQAGPAGQYVSLIEFVLSRLEEAVYEKELGLMHRIKRDIDELTDGLTVREMDIESIQEAKRQLFPRGEPRILLYIDDLDRCPPSRVVEVLEAVQLLVSTELFIVVLGLDTRYITRALEKEYKDILQHSGDPSGLDYIEKIIQLPYRVRPINPERLKAFIGELMRSETTQPSGAAVTRDEGRTRPSGQGLQERVEASEVQEGEREGQQAGSPSKPQSESISERGPEKGSEGELDRIGAGKPLEENLTTAGTGIQPPLQQAFVPTGEAESAAGSLPTEGPRPLELKMISLNEGDKGELERCLKQISLTPRGVKRLVNVLKLLKVFWVNTQGGDPPEPTKRTVIGLLSLSAAYPEAMVEAFARLDTRYRIKENLSQQVGDFLKNIERTFLSDLQHEAVTWKLDNFRKDVDALMKMEDMEGKKRAFFTISLADFQERSFNLVRSFSFVGDPVYAFDDKPPEGGSAEPSANPERQKRTGGEKPGVEPNQSDEMPKQ